MVIKEYFTRLYPLEIRPRYEWLEALPQRTEASYKKGINDTPDMFQTVYAVYYICAEERVGNYTLVTYKFDGGIIK